MDKYKIQKICFNFLYPHIAVISFAITMATIMIAKGNKFLKILNQEKKNPII